jgi:hypothetical protein
MQLHGEKAKFEIVISEQQRLILRAALLQVWRHGVELENGVMVGGDEVNLLRGMLGDVSPNHANWFAEG